MSAYLCAEAHAREPLCECWVGCHGNLHHCNHSDGEQGGCGGGHIEQGRRHNYSPPLCVCVCFCLLMAWTANLFSCDLSLFSSTVSFCVTAVMKLNIHNPAHTHQLTLQKVFHVPFSCHRPAMLSFRTGKKGGNSVALSKMNKICRVAPLKLTCGTIWSPLILIFMLS